MDEFWYDKDGNMLPGDSKRVRQPIKPGEVVTVELRTPKNAKMDRNSYQFTPRQRDLQAEDPARSSE